jgi:hypothetical protein
LAPSNDTVLNFYERRTEGPAALQQWFHPGDLSGVEFPVPKSAAAELAYVTVAQPAPPVEQPPAITETAPPPPPAPQPEAQPQPEQPPQIAQNEPPPAPQEQLPRTAGDAPMVGLIGLLSLGCAALLRSRVRS